MIWTNLLNFLCDVFDNMVSYVPDVNVTIPASALQGLNTLTKNVGYILPIPELLVVFDLWVSYITFRLGVTFYKHRIKLHL